MRIEAAGLAVGVFAPDRDLALPRADCAGGAHFDPAAARTVVGQLLGAQRHDFGALAIEHDSRRVLAEFRLNIVQPEIRRLQHMPVGIDYLVLNHLLEIACFVTLPCKSV
jgi:hypothetical protein